MTVQLQSQQFGKSKRTLEDQLNLNADQVLFLDPAITAPQHFLGSHIKAGEALVVVLDHPKRMRFAKIVRHPVKRSFKVL